MASSLERDESTELGSDNTQNAHVQLFMKIYPTKLCGSTEKKYKQKTMNDINANICALLNGGGGKLVLTYERSPPSCHIADCIRMIEQNIREMIGCARMVSKIQKNSFPNRVDLVVKASPVLITTNYNVFLPTKTQVMAMSPTDPLDEIQEIILDKRPSEQSTNLEDYHTEFVLDKHVELEEDVDVQFKLLKANASKKVTLGDRIIKNKFSCYVSAFGSHRGGHVYYGINDDGVVKGEKVVNRGQIINKVEKAIGKLMWTKKPERRRDWDIFFEQVNDHNGCPIPSTFVIVLAIARYPGGVFVDVPESYYLVNGEVKKMSYETWKTKLMSSFFSVAGNTEPLVVTEAKEQDPLEISSDVIASQLNTKDGNRTVLVPEQTIVASNSCRFHANSTKPSSNARLTLSTCVSQPSRGPSYSWSSSANRKKFIFLTTKLTEYRNDHNMEQFNKLEKMVMEKYRYCDAHLVVMAEKIGYFYKGQQFKKAVSMLGKLEAQLKSTPPKDGPIFEVKVLYLKSRIERAKNNYKESFDLAIAGLQQLQCIPAGLMSAWSCLSSAFLANVLASEEKDKEIRGELRKKERVFLEWSQRDTQSLEEYCECIIDLKQKLHIYQAMSLLGCPLTGGKSLTCSADDEHFDIDKATNHLAEAHNWKLTAAKLSRFRKIQYLLAESILHYHRGISSPQPQSNYIKSAIELVEEAITLGKRHHFGEILDYCERHKASLTEIVVRERIGESKTHEAWISELEDD